MDFGSPNAQSQGAVSMSLLRHAKAAPQLLDSIQARFRLTPTQARVAVLLADRLTNQEIALELGVKQSTARRHTEAVLLRLDINSRFKVVGRLSEFFPGQVA